jgi:type IV pilus assembly protein PilO
VNQNKKISLKDLDFNNTGAWPREFKIGFSVLVGVLILGVLWWLLTRDKGDELAALERTEAELRMEFETKQGRASNLEPLKLQLAQMEQQLQQMLRQLPSRTELFQPGPETPKEFYAEKPIALRMVGSYHQFGAFVSGVASLPRVVIMTMHDIALRPRNPSKDPAVGIRANTDLELAGTVKTYRYLDEEEAAAQEAAAAAAAGGGL